MIDVSIEPRDYDSRLRRAGAPLSRPFGGRMAGPVRRALVAAQKTAFDRVTGPALTPRYAASKPPGAPMLVSSGRLRASLLGGPATELRIEDAQLSVGTSLRYAAPVEAERPFLVAADLAVAAVEEVVADGLDERVAAASGGVLETE